jgi:VWA domain-containing protein
MTEFNARTFQNEYLPNGATAMNAIVTVTASGSETVTPARSEVVIIVDVSGSMAYPSAKLQAAKKATAEALDCIRDGVPFAIIAGYESVEVVYPPRSQRSLLAPAAATTRSEAKRLVKRLRAEGGTAISTWLRGAEQLFSTDPDVIRHVILLTDGCNEGEEPEALDAAIADCEGRFQCDCRGVGADWDVDELRRISSALLGSVDVIPDPSLMEAEFRAMMQQAMAKATNDVRLRVWTPAGAQLSFVKQVSPTVEDLTSRRIDVDGQTGEYPTGAWGEESRDYHICITVPPHEVGDEMLAGRVSLVVDGEPGSTARVRAVWTDDEELSTAINREVAHYTGQVEYADAVHEGLAARRSGDLDSATTWLGRAARLAAEHGDDEKLEQLSGVVDIEDATTGTVRLKPQAEKLDEMVLETRSVKTMRIARSPAP